jgi:hypothetical protein
MSPSVQARPAAPTRPLVVRAGLGAVLFVAAFLVMDLVHGALAVGSRPLPNAPDADIYRYLTTDGPAVAAAAVVLLISGAGLLLFTTALRRALPAPPVVRGAGFGLVAVVALMVSVVVSLVLAAGAGAMTVPVAAGLNEAAFLAGGVVHVVCLGLFAALAAPVFGARSLRVLSWVAAVPAVLSVVSLVWFPASALILLGRLLGMVWSLAVAVALLRAHRTGRPVTQRR